MAGGWPRVKNSSGTGLWAGSPAVLVASREAQSASWQQGLGLDCGLSGGPRQGGRGEKATGSYLPCVHRGQSGRARRSQRGQVPNQPLGRLPEDPW